MSSVDIPETSSVDTKREAAEESDAMLAAALGRLGEQLSEVDASLGRLVRLIDPNPAPSSAPSDILSSPLTAAGVPGRLAAHIRSPDGMP